MNRMGWLCVFVGCSGEGTGPDGSSADGTGTTPSGEQPIPLGTFCASVAGDERCATADAIEAARSEITGNTQFEVIGTLPSGEEIVVTGSAPTGATFPREAMDFSFQIPIQGICTFGDLDDCGLNCWSCETAEDERACDLYDSASVTLEITALSPNEVEATLSGTVAEPSGSCCSSDSQCQEIRPSFEPAGPYSVAARLHVAF